MFVTVSALLELHLEADYPWRRLGAASLKDSEAVEDEILFERSRRDQFSLCYFGGVFTQLP